MTGACSTIAFNATNEMSDPMVGFFPMLADPNRINTCPSLQQSHVQHKAQIMFETLKKEGNDTVTPVEDLEPNSYPEKPNPKPDVEQAREGVEQHPPMTWRRFMALFSLGCLLAAAQIPVLLLHKVLLI